MGQVYKLNVPRKVDLEQLMRGNAVVPNDANAETEWKLLQNNRNSKGNSGVLQSKSGSGSSSHAVVRRYEFYHFTGALDPETNEALCADGECSAPSAGELGAFTGSQMAAANLQAPARITLDRTLVDGGGTVTASVIDGPARAGDWLGLYDGAGAPVTSYRDWKYLNGSRKAPAGGVANAIVPFTLPIAGGEYQLRLFAAGTWDVVATSDTITVTAPPAAPTPAPATIALSSQRVSAGGRVTATIAHGPGKPTDWIGLFEAGSGVTRYLQWQYLNGSTSAPAVGLSDATVTFTLPVTEGTYNLRLFAAGTYNVLATSDPITVAPPTLTLDATTVSPGAAVTVAIASAPGYPGDWIGIYDAGASINQYLQWLYLNGTQNKPAAGLTSATFTFFAPTMPGTYNVPLFATPFNYLVATSASFTVSGTPTGTPATIAISANRLSIGANVFAQITNGPGRPSDWIGLFDVASGATSYLKWQYLNRSQTAPATGLTEAVVGFTLPFTEGIYNIRLFAEGTYNVVAMSEPITVFRPRLSLSAATVAAGETVTASMADGPGARGDWIGLYAEDGSPADYKDWRYLNNEQIFPEAGFSNATVTFRAPLISGRYTLRLFASGSYVVLASASFDVP